MRARVAIRAEGHEIVFRVFPGLAPKLLMVDFEIGHRAAELASPIVTLEHLLA
jgi:hypothetical protein